MSFNSRIRNPYEIRFDMPFEWNLQRLYRGVRQSIDRREFFRIFGKNASGFSTMVNDRIFERSRKVQRFSLAQIRRASLLLGVPPDMMIKLYIMDRRELTLDVPTPEHDQLLAALGANWQVIGEKAQRIIAIIEDD